MEKKNKILLIIILIIIVLGIITYIRINNKTTNEITSQQTINKATSENIPNNNKIKNENYSIKNKDFYLYKDINDIKEEYRGIKLLEYDNTNNNYAEIYYVSYDYTTDPSFYYVLKITDEANNNLLIGEKEQQIIGGVASSVKIKKISENNKINFSVFEKYTETNNISKSAQTQIDLEKDLEEKIKIDQSTNLKSSKLGDVNFKYIDSDNTYFGTTSHAYSSKLVGEQFSVPIKVQYGNRLITEEHIEFSCYKNVNNLNLEETFESLAIINENFGQYGLSDIYGVDITDEQGQVINTVKITFDEMIKLCNGLTIEKDGIKYTKESFEKFTEMPMIKDKYVEIGNKINAIKYYFESNDEDEYYMFLYKDNIYSIRIPTNNRVKDEVQLFLDSLEVEE